MNGRKQFLMRLYRYTCTNKNVLFIIVLFQVMAEIPMKVETKMMAFESTATVPDRNPDLGESLRKLILEKFDNKSAEFSEWAQKIHDEVNYQHVYWLIFNMNV